MRLLIGNSWPVKAIKQKVKNHGVYRAIKNILTKSLEKALEITLILLLIAVIFIPRDANGTLYIMNIPMLSVIKNTGNIVFEFMVREGAMYLFATMFIVSGIYYSKKLYI